jgi:DNA repair exonuclease SbcCD ATPase subunit
MTTPNPEAQDQKKAKEVARLAIYQAEGTVRLQVGIATALTEARAEEAKKSADKIASLESANARLVERVKELEFEVKKSHEYVREHGINYRSEIDAMATKLHSADNELALLNNKVKMCNERMKQLESGSQNWKNLAEQYLDDANKLQEQIEKATEEMKSLHSTHNQAIDKWREAEDKLLVQVQVIDRMREALKFYAEYESDQNGMGGVNGEGLYVIRKDGFQVLDKGKTAQEVLTSTDNNRLMERDRLREAVIRAAVYMATNGHFDLCPILGHREFGKKPECTCGHSRLCESLSALEVHEKGGGV